MASERWVAEQPCRRIKTELLIFPSRTPQLGAASDSAIVSEAWAIVKPSRRVAKAHLFQILGGSGARRLPKANNGFFI